MRDINAHIQELAKLIISMRGNARLFRTRMFLKRLLVSEYIRLLQIVFVDVLDPRRFVRLKAILLHQWRSIYVN